MNQRILCETFGRLAVGDRVLSGCAPLRSVPDADAPSARMAHGRKRPKVVAFGAEEFA
jgi:hypothetical protein